MTDNTKSDLLATLKKIYEPGFNKDVLILNTIKILTIKDHTLTLNLFLPIPENTITTQLKSRFISILKKEYPDIKNVELQIEGRAAHTTEAKKDSILPGVKNTIAIASGKGGVGKSTVAVNLAVALAKDGAEVGLVDADIYGPSIPLMLGISGKPRIYQDKNSMKMIPLESYGIKVMSIGLLVDDNAPIIWRGPMASGAVKQFMSDVEWGNLDYLIFDLPPGTGDIQLKLAEELGVPFLGGIPLNPQIRIGGDNGVPIVFDMPDDEHAKIIMDIARKLASQINLNKNSSPDIEILLDEN